MSKHYSQQFKDEAVALALESDCPYSQIAKDLGVNYQTFGNWMRKAMSSKKTKSTTIPANKKDYQSLERELKAARKSCLFVSVYLVSFFLGQVGIVLIHNRLLSFWLNL